MGKLILNEEFNLYEKDGEIFCDSLQIAESFEKRHDNVLGDIRKILEEVDDKIWLLNFQERDYKDRGKTYPKYLLTKDGFILLVMGYTGKKAMSIKISYITSFNNMKKFINNLMEAKNEFPEFTQAIMEAHEEPQNYHYTNEIDMINKIVLGMRAKKFKEINNIDKTVASIRPYLSTFQIEAIRKLQRIDIGLIISGQDYEQRKNILTYQYDNFCLKQIAV